MSEPSDSKRAGRPPRVISLALNLDFSSRFARKVAALSWWRILGVFLVVMIAANVISDKLKLEHEPAVPSARKSESVRIGSGDKGDSVVITVGGREVVRIEGDPSPASGGTPGESKTEGGVPPADEATTEKAAEAGDARSRRTLRGLLGDLGTVLITLMFAYIVAAKIIVRKTDESDARVQSAEDAATRETFERQLAQARLQVLQAQVEPHFLFNTLGAVDYLIETDPARATQMQKALIRYLRGALPQMRNTGSSLGRELRLVQAYLEIMKMRIEDRLQVAYDVPEGLASAEFPPMMLQSLVENAIKHGIEPKPEGGTVTVAAGIHDGQLWVEVRDSGVGLASHDVMDRPAQGSGIGLRNIRERLAMLYPGAARLVLRSDEQTGTVVRIAVPYRVVADASSATEAVSHPERA